MGMGNGQRDEVKRASRCECVAGDATTGRVCGEKAEGALRLRAKRGPEFEQEAREQGAEGAERGCREGKCLREA